MYAPRCVRPLHLLHPHDKLRVITVPCGKCIACRVRKAAYWAQRALMEYYSCGERGVFLTLTYDDAHCPDYVCKKDLQDFFKRFRHTVGKLRYLACGEYGDRFLRPHYHALLFGVDVEHPIFACWHVDGRVRVGRLADWPHGECAVGAITEQSALYICKYAVKQEHQDAAVPPFLVMSRRPGLGSDYIRAHADSVRSGRDKCIRYKGDFAPSLSRYVKARLDDYEMMTDFDLTPARLARRKEIEQALQSARHELDIARTCPHGVDPLVYERNQDAQRAHNLGGVYERR